MNENARELLKQCNSLIERVGDSEFREKQRKSHHPDFQDCGSRETKLTIDAHNFYKTLKAWNLRNENLIPESTLWSLVNSHLPDRPASLLEQSLKDIAATLSSELEAARQS